MIETNHVARFEVMPMRYAMMGVVAISLLSLGCRNAATPSHETCVKEAIFAIQRATDKLSNAYDYDELLAALESIRGEASKLSRARDEFVAFGEPSSWERSRMRKHRSLLTSANEKWAAGMADMRKRMADGAYPPDVRQKLDDTLTAFEDERKRMNDAIEPFWN